MFKWFGLVNYSPYTKVAAFAQHLRDGRLMASRCLRCGRTVFPPKADCVECMGEEFEFVEISGRSTLHTFTKVVTAPTGFEHQAPYVVGVVDLDEGGRALARFGDTLDEDEIEIGMELQVVPRMLEETEEIHVYYSLEAPQ
jgi:uncharacterized OB-fold protein